MQEPLTKSHKYSSDEIQQIICWISEFKKECEIIRLVREKFGKNMSHPTFLNYRDGQKWQGLIKKHREEWGREIFNIELSHKRRRLDELSEIYHETRENGNFKLALDALEKIKNETEKELGNLHLYNIRVYKSMSDEELEDERLRTMEEIKKLKQISGRVEGETL